MEPEKTETLNRCVIVAENGTFRESLWNNLMCAKGLMERSEQ